MYADKKEQTLDQNLSLKLLVVLTRAVDSIHAQVKDDIKRYGLNTTEFAVLELLYSKGDKPIQKIGEKVLIASSSITYVVDQLEKKQFVVRRRCNKDRRITYASLTEKGHNVMKRIFPSHAVAIQQLFAVLSMEEKKKLIEQLKKIGYYAQKI